MFPVDCAQVAPPRCAAWAGRGSAPPWAAPDRCAQFARSRAPNTHSHLASTTSRLGAGEHLGYLAGPSRLVRATAPQPGAHCRLSQTGRLGETVSAPHDTAAIA